MSTKKKTGLGIAAAGVAALAIAGGTFATFSDTEPGPEADVQAGTLNLVPGGPNGTQQMLEANDIAPGFRVVKTFSYTNTGSVDGLLDVTASVAGAENGCNEPEAAGRDETCGDPGMGQGELDDNLLLVLERGGNTIFDGSVGALDGGKVIDEPLPAGETVEVTATFTLSPSVDNIVQSDSVGITTTAVLEQEQAAGVDPPENP